MNDWWPPLLGVMVGWFLNQLAQWFVFRRDERRAIARALSELMEIRHRILAFPRAIDEIKKAFNINPLPAEEITLQVTLASFFPDDGLSKRYEEAVNLVASDNPVLAFRLRSQTGVSHMLDGLRSIALADKPSIHFYSQFERGLIKEFQSHLEKLILELAGRHSLLTWWNARKSIRKPLELPAELVQTLKAAVQNAASSQKVEPSSG